jgi:hypothetical protein
VCELGKCAQQKLEPTVLSSVQSNMRHLLAHWPALLPCGYERLRTLDDVCPEVDLRCTKELPSCKIPRKRPVDDRRIAFARAVHFALDGVDRALFDMVRLPHQLAVGGLVLLGEALPLVPPVRERLEVRPDGRELCRQVRAERYRR